MAEIVISRDKLNIISTGSIYVLINQFVEENKQKTIKSEQTQCLNCHGGCRRNSFSSGPDCGFAGDSPYGLADWFDNHHTPSEIWRRIMGGKLGVGCGVVDYGNSLHFSGDGTREAVTVPLNTTYLRY